LHALTVENSEKRANDKTYFVAQSSANDRFMSVKVIVLIMAAPAMLAAGHSVLPLQFRSSFFLFLPPNFRGCFADRHQILPHVWW